MTPNSVQSQTDVARHSTHGVVKRWLIVGLDGATFDVLDPLMAAGHMPRFKAAMDGGARGILRSTVPPITPAAWTTFLTGKQPGTHGIIDFERYDALSNTLSLNSARRLGHVRNIWQILSDRGLKVGSINVPLTYPPQPVNGFVVTGFETPGLDSEFVYPADLREDILSRWPDPTLRKNWRRKMFGGDKLVSKNVEYMSRSFHQGADMTRYLGDRFGWDVLMVVLKFVDNLQHKMWKYIDPRWSDRNPRRKDMATRCFQQLDRAIGSLLDYAKENEATVMFISDHGHGSLEGKTQPNLMLERWGYLKLRGASVRSSTRMKRHVKRLMGARGSVASGDLLGDLAVDFAHTKACVMHAGMAGFLYINLQGRQPGGIVAAGDYEKLRDELREKFLGESCRAVDPKGQSIQLFKAVHKPEELYGCSREEQPWLPDLMLLPHDSLAVVRKIRGHQPVRWLPYSKIEGTHRDDGIFVVSGPGCANTHDIAAQIGDCAPTILAMLGQSVPDDMEGRVIHEAAAKSLHVEMVAAKATSANELADETFSEEDIRKVTERLSDLGYLE